MQVRKTCLIEILREIGLEPDSEEALSDLSDLFLDLGLFDIEEDPLQELEHLPCEQEPIDDGRLEEHEVEYRRAIEHHPGNATYHYRLGVVYFKQGRVKEAMQAFQEAIRIDKARFSPEGVKKGLKELGYKVKVSCHEYLSECYLKLGRPEEAEAEIKKLFGIDIDALSAHDRLGDFYSKQNRFEEAVLHYALAYMPEERSGEAIISAYAAEAFDKLNAIFERSERGEITLNLKKLAMASSLGDCYELLGNYYASQLKREKAESAYQEAVKHGNSGAQRRLEELPRMIEMYGWLRERRRG